VGRNPILESVNVEILSQREVSPHLLQLNRFIEQRFRKNVINMNVSVNQGNAAPEALPLVGRIYCESLSIAKIVLVH